MRRDFVCGSVVFLCAAAGLLAAPAQAQTIGSSQPSSITIPLAPSNTNQTAEASQVDLPQDAISLLVSLTNASTGQLLEESARAAAQADRTSEPRPIASAAAPLAAVEMKPFVETVEQIAQVPAVAAPEAAPVVSPVALTGAVEVNPSIEAAEQVPPTGATTEPEPAPTISPEARTDVGDVGPSVATAEELPQAGTASELRPGAAASPGATKDTHQSTPSFETIAQYTGATGTGVPGMEAEGVLQRPKGEFEPIGIEAEGLFLFPSLTSTSTYDSNIFATQSNPTGAWVFRNRPQLTVNNGNNPGTYAVSFNGYLEDVRYVDHGSLGHDDFGLSLDVGGDFEPAARVTSRTAYVYMHQDPSTFQINAATGTLTTLPVQTTFTQDLSATHDAGVLGLTIAGGFERDTYQNFTINGVTFNQTQLDGDIYKIGPKISYEASPGIRPFVEGKYSRLEYDTGGFNANEYLVGVGSDFDITRLLRGSAYVGYNIVDYDSSAISTQSGFSYGVSLQWFPTQLLTLTFSGQQSFEPSLITTTNGTPSITNANVIQGEADYEALRQLILTGIVSYENDNYSSTTRVDNTVTAAAGLRYLVNRNVTLLAQYKFSNRSSTVSGFGYNRNQVGVGLTLAY
jgi:hypothetical protein